MPNILYHARYPALIVFIASVIFADFQHPIVDMVVRENLARAPGIIQHLALKFYDHVFHEQPAIRQETSQETKAPEWVPADSRSTTALDHPATGTFHTGDARGMDYSPTSWDLKGHTTKSVRFRVPYSARPAIPVALMWLDIGNNHNARVECTSKRITQTRFELDILTWSGTQLYEASCAWLELGPRHRDFQSGTFNTEEYRPWWRNPEGNNTRQIIFSHPYEVAPKVVVWLSRIDLGSDNNWRIRAFATDITRTGFTLHIDTWGGSKLFTAGASWVSYRAGMEGVDSGTFAISTRSERSYATFRDGGFTSPPRVMVGLNSLDIKCDHNLRVALGTVSVDEEGMMWYMRTWGDTTLYSAGASYLALA